MNFIYEGKDITKEVEINRHSYTDRITNKADMLEVVFNDTEKLWSSWNPQKGDKIEYQENGFKSGTMYINEMHQKDGKFVVKAISMPLGCKTNNSKSWEDVTFLQLAAEFSAKYGLIIETYGATDVLYKRLDQIETSDFRYLADRCILEGCILKIFNGKMVISSNSYIENLAPVKILYLSDFDGGYDFANKSVGIYKSCKFSYSNIQVEAIDSKVLYGDKLKINDIYVSSIAEAQRFSENILQYKNKGMFTGYGAIALDTSFTAGNIITIADGGLAKGDWLCEEVVFSNHRQLLNFRKV